MCVRCQRALRAMPVVVITFQTSRTGAHARCANDLQARGRYGTNGTAPLKSTLDLWGTSLNLTFTLSEQLQLKSISAYRENDYAGARDADNTPLTILHTSLDSNGHQSSQELQLPSPACWACTISTRSPMTSSPSSSILQRPACNVTATTTSPTTPAGPCSAS